MADEDFPPFGGPPLGAETVPGKSQARAEISAVPTNERGIGEQVNSVLGRVRDLERRFSDTQELLKFHEEESRKNFNRVWARLKYFGDRLTSVTHSLAELEEQSHLIVSELRLTAKKEDFEVMKRFIEYIKPVKFVTVDQVERIVKDILEENSGNKEKFIEE